MFDMMKVSMEGARVFVLFCFFAGGGGGKNSSPSPSMQKRKIVFSIRTAGALPVGLAVSFSKSSSGLMMKVRALGYRQSAGDLVKHGRSCQTWPGVSGTLCYTANVF